VLKNRKVGIGKENTRENCLWPIGACIGRGKNLGFICSIPELGGRILGRKFGNLQCGESRSTLRCSLYERGRRAFTHNKGRGNKPSGMSQRELLH